MQLAARAITLTEDEARGIGSDATAGSYVTISVRDNGAGIAPDIRDRVFDPYFTTKPRESATGLGLATVLRVIRRHHGFIAFESELGHGACFTCYIPTLAAEKMVDAQGHILIG
ncbi:MAG: hypothetical protein QG656_2773, partial [Candidatus Hydrogenedentes bacterium]|nr:hypothetical protein [Candidatus Hydrogenedentota bacterium]